MALKIKYPIHTRDFSTPSQMNAVNLIVNSGEANKDHKMSIVVGL